jgi:hypothetical protein
MKIGQLINEIMSQQPHETYNLLAQQLMFDIVLNMGDNETLDIAKLKSQVVEFAAKITKDEEYDHIRDDLKANSLVELKK